MSQPKSRSCIEKDKGTAKVFGEADCEAVRECCSESTASIALMQSFGFSQVGHFSQVGRKFDRWLDVLFFELLL